MALVGNRGWLAIAMLGTITVGAVLAAWQAGPTRSQLEQDNPIHPNPPVPFGLEDFFDQPPPAPARVRLGRWLFYDQRLSSDRTVSCATCHRPEHAFSQPTAVSTGVGGQQGRRKAPSLLNLASHTELPDTLEADRGQKFFWDGRATSLEAQVLIPIADPKEMGLDHRALIERLAGVSGYRPYFRDAFGSDGVTLERVSIALADYVRMRRSGNAPYDRWSYAGEGKTMSVEAKRGSEIFFFKGRCELCHVGFNFSDGRFHNLGVGWNAETKSFQDEGRAAITGAARDRGAFKTPGLRDASKHAPYMHDGSLATLRDVVEFYNRGGVANPTQSRRIRPLGLTPAEIDSLVAFLHALDGEGYQDRAPRYFPK